MSSRPLAVATLLMFALLAASCRDIPWMHVNHARRICTRLQHVGIMQRGAAALDSCIETFADEIMLTE